MTAFYQTSKLLQTNRILKIRNFASKPVVKDSLFLILTLFSLSILGFFAIRPTLTNIVKLNQKIKEAKKINQTLQNKIISLQEAEKNYKEIQPSLFLVETALPQKPNFNHFLPSLSLIANKNKVLVDSFNISSFEIINGAEGLSSFSFQISIAGSFSDIKNFLTELENFGRLIKVKSVSLSSKKKREASNVEASLWGEISGEIFWLTPKVGE